MRRFTLVHGPAVKLRLNGDNLGAVRTNHPKISQRMLAAIIERELPGASVRILDMRAEYQDVETRFKTVPYGRRTLDIYRVGQPFEEIADEIATSDVVVFTCNFTQEAGVVGDLITFCKRVNPRVQAWVGGSDAMVRRGEVDRPAYYAARGADFVSTGDGEVSLPRLLRHEDVPAVANLADFDDVPNPALHLVHLDRYTESHEGGLPDGVSTPLMYLETSRGCRQTCDFCSTPFTKGRYRYMSQERIEEVLGYYRDCGIQTLLLIEDNVLSRLDFRGGREAVLRWFRCMRRMGFAWEFSNGVEIGKLAPDSGLDDELIDEMFSYDGTAGCFRSYIPLERIDVADGPLPYRKLKTFAIQKQILGAIATRGVLLLNLGVIIGNPSETWQSLRSTEERMAELKAAIVDRSRGGCFPFANFFLHIPICGTNDYRRFHAEDRMAFDIKEHPELYNFYTSVLVCDHFHYTELTEIRREMAFRINGEELMGVWEDGGRYYPDHIGGPVSRQRTSELPTAALPGAADR
jgi:hypothetical protein